MKIWILCLSPCHNGPLLQKLFNKILGKILELQPLFSAIDHKSLIEVVNNFFMPPLLFPTQQTGHLESLCLSRGNSLKSISICKGELRIHRPMTKSGKMRNMRKNSIEIEKNLNRPVEWCCRSQICMCCETFGWGSRRHARHKVSCITSSLLLSFVSLLFSVQCANCIGKFPWTIKLLIVLQFSTGSFFFHSDF